MNKIGEILEKKGIKQTWLAEQLNKSYNMINSYVRNRRQPSIEILFKIAFILKVNPKDLIDDEYSKLKAIRVIGSIACGSPDFANQEFGEIVEVDERVLKNGYEYYALTAKGNSMNLSNINEGDTLIIRNQNTAQNGDKVVALIDDEATMKIYEESDNKIYLKPNSSDASHKVIELERDVKIQGIIEHIINI